MEDTFSYQCSLITGMCDKLENGFSGSTSKPECETLCAMLSRFMTSNRPTWDYLFAPSRSDQGKALAKRIKNMPETRRNMWVKSTLNHHMEKIEELRGKNDNLTLLRIDEYAKRQDRFIMLILFIAAEIRNMSLRKAASNFVLTEYSVMDFVDILEETLEIMMEENSNLRPIYKWAMGDFGSRSPVKWPEYDAARKYLKEEYGVSIEGKPSSTKIAVSRKSPGSRRVKPYHREQKAKDNPGSG